MKGQEAYGGAIIAYPITLTQLFVCNSTEIYNYNYTDTGSAKYTRELIIIQATVSNLKYYTSKNSYKYILVVGV